MNAVTGKPWKGLLALLLFGELANFSPVRGGAVSFDVQLHCTGRVQTRSLSEGVAAPMLYIRDQGVGNLSQMFYLTTANI
jgi:hypothetical protein